MKTDIHTFKPAELLATLAKVAPSVAIETIWQHDNDIHPDIRKDCDGFENEDPDDWRAWRSEVRASAVVDGKSISGSSHLGGTWEKAVDHPAKSNPSISGYLPQMIEEALRELLNKTPSRATKDQIKAALVVI